MTQTVRLSVLIAFVGLLLLPFTIFAYDAGNDAINRGNVDSYQNFTIVDTNNSFDTDGNVVSFEYFAANTNPFKVVIVDEGGVVKWVSDTETPDSDGVGTFSPAAPVPVEAGWNLAIYSVSSGVISFDFEGAPAYYTFNNVGEPEVDDVLVYQSNQNRHYSINATLSTDDDGDGILNGADKCEGGDEADEVPLYGDKTAKNRFKWNGEAWVTNAKAGTMGDFKPVTLADTLGCTGDQILDAMSDATGMDFGGEYKYGITKGTLESWIAGVYLLDTVTVNSANYLGADSTVALDDANDYIVKASGTWTNRPGEVVDAEYSNYSGMGWEDAPFGVYSADLIDLQVAKTFVDWGAINETTHTYEIPFTPAIDGVVNFRVFDHSDMGGEPDGSWYGDNVGNLMVQIYADLW